MSDATETATTAGDPQGEASALGTNRVLSVICHDMRSPLSSIVMGADFLRRSLAKQEGMAPEKRVLEGIARSAHRLNSLISKLHDIAQIETGRFVLDKHSLDVGAMMATAAERYGNLGATNGVTVEVGEVASATQLECDSGRVFQALGELVENAVRYSPAGTTVQVGFELAEGRAAFSVTDKGLGMSEERLEHAFEHVWHASQTPRDGTGLGLALVKGIAVAHGGGASVESEKGTGTRVSFWVRPGA
jgi:signal transduction histidine kinase